MNSNSEVSVIIPCYNAERLIERALNSVISQTTPPREIILIDDASTDDTLNELERLKDLHEEFSISIIQNEKNLGPGLSRNKGWSIAKGTWIAFLDADDAWDPDKIEHQLNLTEDNKDVSIFCHDSILLGNATEQVSTASKNSQNQLTMKAMMFKNSVSTRTVMLKKNLPQRFSNGLAEDLALWLACLNDGVRILKTDSRLAYIYRPEYSPGGISSNLIKHEIYELKVLARYFKLMPFTTSLALCFSLGKFIRRCLIRVLRRILK